MNDPAPHPPPNQQSHPPEVPDFELIRSIGRGGFGEVWLARNRTTGRLRAVKLIALHGTGSVDPAGREIVSLTNLEAHVGNQHPNLLSIHHVGKTADHLFYVMDPADDVSGSAASPDPGYRPAALTSRLQHGPLPPQDCLAYARQLLEALAHLHDAGMVHRDVKPGNCLFVGGKLKLADFGLLTEADSHASRIGTLKYMPPDGHMDARADVYAVGLVIYEMLTGLPAESFPRLGDRARQVADDSTLRTLNRLMLRACQNSPQRRFRNAREMLNHLLDAQSRSTAPGRPRRRQVLIAIACLVGLLVTSVAVWRLGRPRPSSVPQRVHVNFVTQPLFGATIHLDGELWKRRDGTPYTTPCTVPDVPARVYHVVLRHPEAEDLDVGRVDFAKHREIVAPLSAKR